MILTNDFRTDAKTLKLEVEQRLVEKLKELPTNLARFILDKCVLSGGCFASLLHGETPKDYDIWCLDDADLPELQRYMNVYNEQDSSLIDVENPAYMHQFVDGKIETANATTLKNGIQLVKLSNYATAKQSFDFEHCKVSYIPASGTMYMSKLQYNSIKEKVLVPTKSAPYTANINKRLAKFNKRGWR